MSRYRAPGVTVRYTYSEVKPIGNSYYLSIQSPITNINYKNTNTITVNGITNAPQGSVINSSFNLTKKTATVSATNTWTISDIDLNGLADGEYPLTITLIDEHFNTTSEVIIVVIDSTNPTLTVTLLDDSYTTNKKPEVNGTVYDSGIDSLKVSFLDSGSGVAFTSTITSFPNANWTVTPTTDLADDMYTVEVVAKDKAGNETEINIDLTIDATSPTLPTGLSTAYTSGISADIIWVPSSDIGGVKHYEIYDGDDLIATSTTKNYNLVVEDGIEYNISIAAVDNAGNKSVKTSPITFTGA
jgi:hypothetical protein